MFIHLTNYAINKDNSDKFRSSDNAFDDFGHKRSFQTILGRLANENVDTEYLLKSIKDIIIKTLISIQPQLSHNYRICQPNDKEMSMCFEILGFDIILDSKAVPYLLEVNHSPSFNTDTTLDYLIKKQMIVDTISLLGVSLDEKKKKIDMIYEAKQQKFMQKASLKS